jgi:hypothetical protein
MLRVLLRLFDVFSDAIHSVVSRTFEPFTKPEQKKIDIQLFFLTERIRQHGLELQSTEGRTSMKR